MTRRQLLVVLMICILALSSCGKDLKTVMSTDALTTDTSTEDEIISGNEKITETGINSEHVEISDNKETTKNMKNINAGLSPGDEVIGEWFDAELDEAFEGKFGRFKVSSEWEISTASVNTVEDTSYFHLSKESVQPAIMYQYEIAEGVKSLSDDDWNTIVKSAEGERISDRIINDRFYARLTMDDLERGLRICVYYTFENQVLQGISIIYPLNSSDEQKYIDFIEKIIATFEINQDDIESIQSGSDR